MQIETGPKGSASTQRELWGARAADWSEVQEDTVLPLYQDVLKKTAIGKGTRLLDVGCGSGRFCQMASQRGAEVSGLDATPALIEIAKSRVPKGSFQAGEMETLPYDRGHFQVVTGMNSFQYAARPVNALREACRVAREDSAVVVAVWGKAAECQAASYLAAVGKFLPPPPPDAPGPFALSEKGALEELAREAGLMPVEVNAVDCPWIYPDLETALRGLLSAGPAYLAMKVSGEKPVREAVVKSLEPFRTAAGGYRMENKFLYLLARA
jgi:SAM-dependent methyltransferase